MNISARVDLEYKFAAESIESWSLSRMNLKLPKIPLPVFSGECVRRLRVQVFIRTRNLKSLFLNKLR